MKSTVWEISEKKSAIHFKVKYLQIGIISGVFLKFSGVVRTEGNFINPEVSLMILSSSIETYDAERNKKLISEPFLNAAQYPYIGFVSSHGSKLSSGRIWELNGELIVKLSTSPLTVVVKTITIRNNLKAPFTQVSLFGTIPRDSIRLDALNTEDVGTEIQIFADLYLKKRISSK